MFLKSKFLASVRPFYDAEKEGKSAADLEREKVNVTDSTDKDKEKEDVEDKDDKDVEGAKEGEDKEDEESDDGEKGDDEKDDKEKKELTEEQKTILKLEKTIERLQKRVGRTTGERDTIKKDLNDAKAALEEAKVEGKQPLTEEEVERRAEAKATEKQNQKEFDNAQAKLIKEATAIDKTFMVKVQEMAKDVAPIPAFMIGALEDLDNGGAVLNYLTDNVEDYEEIFQLTPAKMVMRLTKISDKLIEEAKPKKKVISKVPPPNDPISGGTRSPQVLSDKMPMDDWVRLRAEQSAAHKKRKLGLVQ